jgi:hypothetical protein
MGFRQFTAAEMNFTPSITEPPPTGKDLCFVSLITLHFHVSKCGFGSIPANSTIQNLLDWLPAHEFHFENTSPRKGILLLAGTSWIIFNLSFSKLNWWDCIIRNLTSSLFFRFNCNNFPQLV